MKNSKLEVGYQKCKSFKKGDKVRVNELGNERYTYTRAGSEGYVTEPGYRGSHVDFYKFAVQPSGNGNNEYFIENQCLELIEKKPRKPRQKKIKKKELIRMLRPEIYLKEETKMGIVKILREEFEAKIKEIQENCSHEKTEWMDYMWARSLRWRKS